MQETRAIITQLLTNMGSQREVAQYLRQFSSLESTKFAVIKVGGGVIADHLDDLCSALTFLYQVALYPIVVHGAGPQLNAALAAEGIETKRIDGLRVTDDATMKIARRVFRRVNEELVEALEAMGTRARTIPTGVFEGKHIDRATLGHVGDVTATDLDPIRSAIRSHHLPILASLAETDDGQLLNVNADVAARVLAERIEPTKVVFLTPTGGVLSDDGELIRSINLVEDYEPLMAAPWLQGGMRLKVVEIKQLLDALPASSSVAVTSPRQLPKELFTHRGSGTLFRRGEKIHRVDGELTDATAVDRDKLGALLEDCFERKLVDDYFATKRFHRTYVTDTYRATAVLTDEGGVPYLDKFAVSQSAQGDGLGGTMWDRMVRETPKLFWRSRVDNKKINPWYFSRCQGSFRNDQWVVFWYGLDGFEETRDCIERALAMPPSLVSHRPLP